MGILDRVKNAWNAFNDNSSQNQNKFTDLGYGNSSAQFLPYRYNNGSIIDTIKTKIAIDVSMIEFNHTIKYKDGVGSKIIKDGLNNILSLEANIDQSCIEFMQDLTFSMMDEGCIAVVITDANNNPLLNSSYDIYQMRIGKITQWYPKSVEVRLYNEAKGEYQNVIVSKNCTAIIQNPFYYIMNDNNSTLKRLSRKLALLDRYDEDLVSNTLNMILQFPYEVRAEQQMELAEKRVKQIESQLARRDNKHGIAYIGGNEKLTQIGANKDNNLMTEIQHLTTELLNQLGMTSNVLNGTASETEMKYYMNRTVYPICKKIALEFTRKFLTQTARTQGHYVSYKVEMFALVPLNELANTVDVLRRNTMITANEGRKILGFQPSEDPSADALFNPNVTAPDAVPGVGDETPVEVLPTMINKLNDQQYSDVLEYIKGIVGDFDENEINSIIESLDESQIADITNYVKSLLPQEEQTEEVTQ